MDVNDLKSLFGEVNKRMKTAIEHVRHELAGVRTGRASVTILDSVHVEAYGARMPLNQLAGLSVPEPSLIVAQPFDPSQLGAIEKAIRASDLGLNPANDGKVVRIPDPVADRGAPQGAVPARPQARRGGPNSVRQVRRDANDRLKKLLKDHKISEDDEKKGLDEVQKLTDVHVKNIDELQKKKDQELLGKLQNCSLQNANCILDKSAICNGPMSGFFSHLECSVPCGAPPSIHAIGIISVAAARPCWHATISPRRAAGERIRSAGRPPTMWRYRELMPHLRRRDRHQPRRGVHSPLPRYDLGTALGLERLYVKDESLNPTNSFKARGQSAAITRAKYLGAQTIALPDGRQCGQCGRRLCGRRRTGVRSLHAQGRETAVRRRVPLVRRHGDPGRRPDHRRRPAGRRTRRAARLGTTSRRSRNRSVSKARRRWPTSSPSRWRGSGPTGSSIRPAAERAWSACGRPSTSSKRLAGCRADGARGWSRSRPKAARPIVRAFESGTEKASAWENATTVADGLRVPAGHRRLPDPARDPGKRRHGDRRVGSGHDRRHAGAGALPRGSAPPRKAARRLPPCGG